jgi:hypothetical protein
VETSDSLLNYDFSIDTSGVFLSYDSKRGLLTINSQRGVEGNFNLRIKIEDDSNAVAEQILPVEVKTMWSGLIPEKYLLEQNYPNPFNPETTIRFAVPVESEVEIKVFNTIGQFVGIVYSGVNNEGYYEIDWSPEDLSSGIYLYSMYAKAIDKSKDVFIVKKMMYVK